MLNNNKIGKTHRNKLRSEKAQKTLQKIEAAGVKSRVLPIDANRRVAVYARQSTFIQVEKNEQSFKDQTEGQRKKALKFGWREDQIDIILTDIDYSGTVDIDDREGLSNLLQGIKAGIYSAVICFLEDRLFRDEYLDNATRFARACGENGCLLITERYTYDLSDEMERERFFMEVRFGWAYYKNQILGHLHAHKQSATLDGKYDGRFIALGYTVCTDKNHEQYKKYIILPEHAEVVRSWFQRFIELNGNMGKFCYELRNHTGPHIPGTSDEMFHKKSQFKEYIPGNPSKGYVLRSAWSIHTILSNRVYLGEWKVKDVWVPNNHPAIIDEATFNKVQRLLALGKQQPRKRHTVSKLILHGLDQFHGPEGTTLSRTPDGQPSEGARYIVLRREMLKFCRVASLPAEYIDQIFLAQLFEHIKQGGYENFAEQATELKQRENTRTAKIMESIENVEKDIAFHNTKMEAAKGFENLKTVVFESIAEVSLLTQRKAALEEKLDTVPQEGEKLMELLELLEMVQGNMEKFPSNLLNRLAGLALREALLEPLSMHFFHLLLRWTSPSWTSQDILVFRRQPAKYGYTKEENAFLQTNYPTIDLNELMEHFPTRSYAGLAAHVMGSPLFMTYRSPINLKYPTNLSIEDLKVMEKYGLKKEELDLVYGLKGEGKKQECYRFKYVMKSE